MQLDDALQSPVAQNSRIDRDTAWHHG